ncbi:MAG TPA: EAL domain-containing protein, partial [Acidimicrobiales bacterium]|nr:EAL domain-containing protein [Acidimicrobiales bacterium]
GADVAALSYLPNDGGKLVQNCVGPGATTHLMREVALSAVLPLWDRVAGGISSFHFGDGDDGGIDLVRSLLPDVELKGGWVVPLRGESRVSGVLVVANHLRTIGGFTTADVRMLETLAGHLSVALENGRLEQSLAELRSLQDELTYAATHDSLTRLPNRALFSETTNRAVEASGGGRPLGVLFVDLDDFKTVNDSLGHAAGDELLIVVSQRIGACLRGGDFAARLGGDEFAVLVRDGADVAAPGQVAERIIASLSAPIGLSAGQVRVGASVGVAVSTDGDTAQSLMRNADMAMYRAKELGKGRWAMFSPDMHAAAVRRQDLTSDLLTGIDDGQLSVHLQPLVDLHNGRLLGAEALVRWDHPRFGRLAPDTFIAIAEESGNIGALTRFVLREACRIAVGWPAPEPGRWEGVVTVNLSARDFDDGDLVRSVRAALDASGLAPERLMLEITETLMLNDPVSSAVQLDGLAALGVHIALDDFGTGYSSLSQLGRLPLGWVKIAKPFVDAIGVDVRGEALVRAIVDMGAALGVRVIAEGIETVEQLTALQRLGADVGQGFYISRPLAADGFAGWLDGRLGQVLPLTPAPAAGHDPAVEGAGAVVSLDRERLRVARGERRGDRAG